MQCFLAENIFGEENTTINIMVEKIQEKNIMNKIIAVVGTGYVGLSIATLLAQYNKVFAVDIIPEKVEKINHRVSPIQDDYIEDYLANQELDLTATLDSELAYTNAEYVVIAAPTNYDSQSHHFDTSAVEQVIETVMKYNKNAIMVIKSTIPVGYTASIRENTPAITLFPALNFCGRARHCMIIFIQVGSLSGQILQMKDLRRPPENLHHY